MSDYGRIDGRALDRYITGNYGEDQFEHDGLYGERTSSHKPERWEVEELKAAWRSDPCWDIYNTEGFEAYSDELRTYQEQMEAQWEREHAEHVQRKAEELGVPGNGKLALYVMALEHRIAKLEERIHGD